MRRILLCVFFVLCAVGRAAFSNVPDSIDIKWMVDGNLYSQSTCEYGGDVILPDTPTKRGHTFVGWRRNYIEIEYLESAGTQYIDTGYIADYQTGIKAKLQFDTVVNNGSLVFGGGTQWAFELFPWDGKLSVCYGGKYVYPSRIEANDIVEIDWNRNKVTYKINNYIDDYEAIFDSKNFKDTETLYLFALHRAIHNNYIKIYYFQIYDNGNLVRDFIPVLDQQAVPCMYDRLTNEFFYNQGTGQFIAGPIKS